ncbi:MAG: hypothetical protein C4K58_03415 [Flavobacteriaceae bacterium]|nr:MAG: hypothetical protein C4K58_03415 [Flavobacteriaceae bacterium]
MTNILGEVIQKVEYLPFTDNTTVGTITQGIKVFMGIVCKAQLFILIRMGNRRVLLIIFIDQHKILIKDGKYINLPQIHVVQISPLGNVTAIYNQITLEQVL